MSGAPVLFGLAGAAIALFARQSVRFSLRPFVSKQRLAEMDKPEHRRLRRWFAF
jgi:hypothetical protein